MTGRGPVREDSLTVGERVGYLCPECHTKFATPEELRPHILTHESEAHPPFVDPLDRKAKSEEMADLGRRGGTVAKKWDCKPCGFVTGSGFAWSLHKRDHHGGVDPRGDSPPLVVQPRRAKKPTASAESEVKDVIDRLRAKRQRAIDAFVEGSEQIQQIDKAIEALEVLR
jgi:hypothetical protein